MGLILVFIFIILLIGFFGYIGTERAEHMMSNAIFSSCVAAVIFIVILIMVVSASYKTHVDLKRQLVTIEQYRETVNLYAKRGVSEFKTNPGSNTEFTDLKYNKYQDQIGQMIKDLRNAIVAYNTILTEKQVMNENWFFGWVIIVDEDMKPIKMAIDTK